MYNFLLKKMLVFLTILSLFGMTIAFNTSSNIIMNNHGDLNENFNMNINGPGVDDYIIEDTVGIWHFDEGSGPIAYDSSEYGNHGSCHDTQWSTDTPSGYGHAMHFYSSTNSYVAIDDDPVLDFNGLQDNEGLMIDFWIKKDKTPTGYAGLVAKVYSDGGYSVRISNNDKIGFLIHNGIPGDYEIIYSNTPIIDTSFWHHIVSIWFNKTMYIYIDDMDNPDISQYLGYYPIGNTHKWLDIGNDWPTDNENPFDGLIDEVSIHKIIKNEPPNAPIITGPESGRVGVGYDYTFIGFDPEDQKINYWIDWGDEIVIEWFGPYDSGEPITISHTWNIEGNYIIKAKIKDIYDSESEWGTLNINIPRSKLIGNIFFIRLLKFFPILERMIL